MFIYICSLEWFIFSKSIEFMYLNSMDFEMINHSNEQM